MSAALPPTASSTKLPTTSLPFSRALLHVLPKPQFSFTPRATPDSDSSSTKPESASSSSSSSSSSSTSPDSDPFESRLSRVRFRYRSGTGKKAQLRKSRKSGSVSGSTSSSSSIYLPPVPLKEAISNGLKVDFGFSPYSERINGRIAILGLTALVLVELATGKSVISYHTPAIILIQIYFVAAVGALFVKYEKEKVSVWPPPQSSSPKT
ncbi:cell wall integrity and stress response component 1-like [Durio zibethinus]|uniref:Cell wall integrity and stress response component 1-like n=1 Tax=Durio zibethinus TaxID=66656 RepID=A0A6P5Z0H8_DURZI|nr:cell wall integrity and stress response component 1-like [Durio zibethinus]